MITRAIILLPPRPKSLIHTDTMDPLVYLGGITLIQRTLYNLQWAGITKGKILSHGEWPDVERLVQQDEKNRAFTWIPSDATAKGEPVLDELDEILSGDFLLQTPWWIVDRQITRELIQKAEMDEHGNLKRLIILEPGNGRSTVSALPPATLDLLPPLALVPGQSCRVLAKAVKERVPMKELAERLSEIPDVEMRHQSEPYLLRAATKADRPHVEAQLFQGLIKPTESLISRKFERKISLWITRKILYSGITPNQISMGSILVGLISALFFLAGDSLFHVFGALLLAFSSIVDGCDGELARLRFEESRVGSRLDFLGDNLVHMAVFFCIGLGCNLHGYGKIYLVLGTLAALATLVTASMVFFRVFRESTSSVITFATPVRVQEMDRATGKLRRQIDFADKISNRDFIYLILFLSLIDQLWIFAWFSGVGTSFYLAYLIYLYRRMKTLGGDA